MKKIFTKIIILTLAVITALSFSACSLFIDDGASISTGGANTPPNSSALSSTVTFQTIDEEQREDSFVKAVAKTHRSVVAITMTNSNSTSYGSGVLVDIKSQNKEGKTIESENEFYILTCYHVVSGGGDIKVYLPDKNGRNNGDPDYDTSFTFSGVIDSNIHKDKAITLVGGDKDTDVAVLKLDISNNLGGIKASDIVCAKVPANDYVATLAEEVYAIGNPGGYLPATVSRGIISYVDRQVSISEVGLLTLFQHDASIDHGSSGGGLFNMYGELIGITNAGSDVLNSIFYAIPYKNLIVEKDNGFINVSKQLISSKTENNYGYISGRWMLGITIVEKTDVYGAAYVGITEVVAGSNAALAGLQVGDILMSVSYVDKNGEKIITNVTGNNSFSGIVSELKKNYTIGDTFTISIKRLEGRTYKYYDKQLTLSKQLIFCDTGK